MGVVCTDQFNPPLEVEIIVPLAPDAQPAAGEIKNTELRSLPDGLVCNVQLLPVFDVMRIVPPEPTAYPIFPEPVGGKQTE